MTRKARSFRNQADLRRWLDRNHATETELMMRLFKVHARRKGIGYTEALDEALCFGWIDGVRKSLDEDSFLQRFSPRKPRSNWSSVNIKRVKALMAAGRMHAAGVAAFNARDEKASAAYSFEHGPKALDPAFEKRFRANRRAWSFWERCPPYYRRVVSFYIMSAKREETRERRFGTVLRYSSKGQRIPLLTPAK